MDSCNYIIKYKSLWPQSIHARTCQVNHSRIFSADASGARVWNIQLAKSVYTFMIHEKLLWEKGTRDSITPQGKPRWVIGVAQRREYSREMLGWHVDVFGYEWGYTPTVASTASLLHNYNT